MSKRKERISAFLDDDLHRDELMSFSLSAESDDAEIAQRYQMMGDALRHEMSESSFVDVSAAVREALADENITDAMTSGNPVDERPVDGNHQADAVTQTSSFDWSSWFRPAAGMAMAATVAVVLVTGLSEQGNPVVPIANNTEQQAPVQLAVDDKVLDTRPVSNQNMNLDPYINQHLEFATQDTLQGRLPYVRAVSFEHGSNVESETSESGKTE